MYQIPAAVTPPCVLARRPGVCLAKKKKKKTRWGVPGSEKGIIPQLFIYRLVWADAPSVSALSPPRCQPYFLHKIAFCRKYDI